MLETILKEITQRELNKLPANPQSKQNVERRNAMRIRVFPFMKKQGFGKIINISSSTIFKGSPYFVHYVTSKAGVIGMTRALAREAGDYGITVNAVAPGLTVTEENIVETPPDRIQKAIELRCIKRQQVPQDLVGVLLFLASSQSDFISGQLINVDGGGSMY